MILKFIWQRNGPKIPNLLLSKMNMVNRPILPENETYYKTMVTKTVLVHIIIITYKLELPENGIAY